MFAVAIPRLLRRRLAFSEISASQDLQKVDAAIRAYAKEHGRVPPDLGSLQGQVPPALSCSIAPCEYRLYRFRYSVRSPEPGNMRYSLSAQAITRGGSSFYLDETGIVRRTSENREATSSDPPLATPRVAD
jgi:hypothetical protein